MIKSIIESLPEMVEEEKIEDEEVLNFNVYFLGKILTLVKVLCYDGPQ